MPTKEKALVFRDTVILPALQAIGLASDAAAELLLGTALVESRLSWRRQLGNGPARGLFQMEMATHDDIWKNYLNYRAGLAAKVKALKSAAAAVAESEVENNDLYAAAMARVLYKRAPAALPAAGDLEAMATYWKQYYNTPLGKGTVGKYIEVWNGTMSA